MVSTSPVALYLVLSFKGLPCQVAAGHGHAEEHIILHRSASLKLLCEQQLVAQLEDMIALPNLGREKLKGVRWSSGYMTDKRGKLSYLHQYSKSPWHKVVRDCDREVSLRWRHRPATDHICLGDLQQLCAAVKGGLTVTLNGRS